MNDVAETETFIKAALTSKYENGSVIIQSMNMTIVHIGKMDFQTGKISRCVELLNEALQHVLCILYFFSEPKNCSEETKSTIYGQYIWPEAFPQVTQVMGCIEPESGRAYRLWWVMDLFMTWDNDNWNVTLLLLYSSIFNNVSQTIITCMLVYSMTILMGVFFIFILIIYSSPESFILMK